MKRKKEVISYLFFGVLTTLINILSYVVLSKLFEVDYKLATTIAWVISVLFAFITNKLYVFNSKETNIVLIAKEFIIFYLFPSIILSHGSWNDGPHGRMVKNRRSNRKNRR